MNCNDCIAQLHDYVDGELSPSERHACDTHLAQCPRCRAELESLRALLRATAALPKEVSPERDLWPAVKASLVEPDVLLAPGSPPRDNNESPPRTSGSTFLQWFAPFAVAASIVVCASLVEPQRTSGIAWEVAAVAGAPRVGSQTVYGEAKLRVGQWLETDANSRARVSVGQIGNVSVEPNSRLRLAEAAATDHRLELARGTLHAFIIAPPRIFFVDTPSATGVDLGCAYTLAVNDAGDGELRVETGYVSLEHEGREAIIPSGMMCLTRKGAGPGTPFVEGAPQALRDALMRFDFQRGASPALKEILAAASGADAVTLWHLLARTEGAQRGDVFDRLAQFNPPPQSVTRDGILAGNKTMRDAWGSDLGLGRL